MKKRIAIFMALAMLLTLTACGKKAEQPAPVDPPAEKIPVALIPELTEVPALTIPAEKMEGRLPGGEYELPVKVIPMLMWQREGMAGLLAEEDDVAFYALEGKESSPALLRWGDSQAEFDWQYVTPQAIEPELWVYDVDGDGEDEVAADCYGGSGTGVSLEYLYVVEKDEDGALTSYGLTWESLEKVLNEQLQTISVNDATYVALGRELVDISAALEGVKAENVKAHLGPIVSYRPVEEGFTCSFGVAVEGDGIAYLALYVAEIEGVVRYEDGQFMLEELHLLSM